LGFKDGNGLWAMKAPGGVKNAVEGGSSGPNGLEEKSRIALKR
jgi:hypothetical protein